MKIPVVAIIASVIFVGLSPLPSSAQTDSWVQTNLGGASSPAPRACHAFVGTDGQYAYLFGGYSNGGYLSAELWRYDYLTKSWTLLPASGPAKRQCLAGSFGAGKFVIFGGASGVITEPYYHDTWIYTESTGAWTNATPKKCNPARPCPPARTGLPAMAYDSSRGYHVLFGGEANGPVFGDTWIFSASTGRWTEAQFATGTPSPGARWGAALAYVAPVGQVVLFGGADQTHLFSDLWGWDGAKWNVISQNNAGPALAGIGMTYDIAQGRLVVFGGTNPFISVLTADTWTFDFATRLWTDLGTTTGLGARAGSPMAYLSKYGVRVFACGFESGGFVNDTWEGK